MATCPTSQQLSAYHDGELDQPALAEIERHLPQCPSCTAELARLRAVSAMFAEAPVAKLSQIGLYRLHRRVESAMEEGLMRFVRVLNTVAACVLIAGSAFLMIRTRQDNRAVENTTPSAPPWVGVDVAETSDSSTGATATPAAMWYLADDSNRGEDSP